MSVGFLLGLVLIDQQQLRFQCLHRTNCPKAKEKGAFFITFSKTAGKASPKMILQWSPCAILPTYVRWPFLQTQPDQSLSELYLLCVLSHLQLFTAPWTVAHQAPLSSQFSRQEYWSGLPFPPPRDLPDPGIKPTSPTSPALAGISFTTESHGKTPRSWWLRL